MYVFCKYFLSVFDLSPHFPEGVFHKADIFNFNEVQLISYFFHRVCLWYCNSIIITNPHSSKFLSMSSSWSFIFLHFTLRSMIHIVLNFVKSEGSVSRLTFLACECPVVQTLCVEMTIFSPL